MALENFGTGKIEDSFQIRGNLPLVKHIKNMDQGWQGTYRTNNIVIIFDQGVNWLHYSGKNSFCKTRLAKNIML